MIGSLVKSARVSRNVGVCELAQLVGVSPTCISLLERDRTEVSLVTLKRLAAVLNVDYEDLVLASGKLPEGLRDVMKEDNTFSKIIHQLTACQVKGYLSGDHFSRIQRLLPAA